MAPVFWTDDMLKQFWTDADYMALEERTVTKLKEEGIEKPLDLEDFDADTLKSIFAELRKPPKKKDGDKLQDQEPYALSAKSKMRILVAATAVEYYIMTARPLTLENMAWKTLKSFDVQWKAIQARKDNKEPAVPKLTKHLAVPKWADAFRIHLRSIVGVRNISVLYTIRPDSDVSVDLPKLAVDQPHSERLGSVEEDAIERTGHAHTLFRVDSGIVFDRIEDAVRGTPLAATIAPFRRTRNGRGDKFVTCWHISVMSMGMVTTFAPQPSWTLMPTGRFVEGTRRRFLGRAFSPPSMLSARTCLL